MANEELATAIRQVKSGKEFHFALIAKSGNPQLAMDKRKLSGEEIARMKKAAGGGALIRGTCVMEDGTLILMTSASTSDAIGAQLKKMIKEETGLTVNCAFRASAAADEEEEIESEEKSPAPGPAPLAKRPLMVEFADLVKANAATIKDQPEVAKLARGIKAALDADELEDAAKLIGAFKRQTT